VDRLEPVEVRGLVAALYLFTRGRPALDDVEGRQERLQPLAALDVRLRRVEPRQVVMTYEVHGDLRPTRRAGRPAGSGPRSGRGRTPPPRRVADLLWEGEGRRRRRLQFAGRAASPPPRRRSARPPKRPRACRTRA